MNEEPPTAGIEAVERRHSWQTDRAQARPMPAAAPMGAVYGLGFIGAVVYYIQTATSFWGGVLGILKAFVWPAFLTYELLRFVGG